MDSASDGLESFSPKNPIPGCCMLENIHNVNRLGSQLTLPETLGMQWGIDQQRFYATPFGQDVYPEWD